MLGFYLGQILYADILIIYSLKSIKSSKIVIPNLVLWIFLFVSCWAENMLTQYYNTLFPHLLNLFPDSRWGWPLFMYLLNSRKWEGLPRFGASGKEFPCQCWRHKRCRFHPWVGKIPWWRKWQPIPIFQPGKSHGQRNLEGYSPCCFKRVRHNWATKYNTMDSDLLFCKLAGHIPSPSSYCF